jgi:hypothetical protein
VYQPLDADLTTLATNGFGTGANQVVQLDSNGFIPPAISKISFRATKGGTNQTITAAVTTKITFTTEDFDVGSYYDNTNSKWTPPAGTCCIFATVQNASTATSGDTLVVTIYKNGVAFRNWSISQAGNNSNGIQAQLIDQCSGTDFYEVYMTIGGTGSKTVSGGIAASAFEGYML